MAEQRQGGTQRKGAAGKGSTGGSPRKRATTKDGGKPSTSSSARKSGSASRGSSGSSSGRTSKPRAPSGSGASTSESSGSARQASGDGRDGGMSAREAVRRAREQLSELTDRPVESVLGMQRDEDGWVITVQLVELARIPNSTDVLGEYAVTLDGEGEVAAYRRVRRYHRGQADDG